MTWLISQNFSGYSSATVMLQIDWCNPSRLWAKCLDGCKNVSGECLTHSTIFVEVCLWCIMLLCCLWMCLCAQYLIHDTTKCVFGHFRPGQTQTGLRSHRIEILANESRDILSKQRTTKALIRLRGCAGWSAPLLFAYDINRFSHVVAH